MTKNTVTTDKAAASQAHSPGEILAWIAVIAVVTWAAISVYSRWSVSKHIFDHEKELRAGKIVDESTVVLITANDASGVRAAYYKLGNGAYANALRLAGIGCRFYSPKGTVYLFEKFKPVDPIPYDAIADGSIVRGQCNANAIDGFDLARAQKYALQSRTRSAKPPGSGVALDACTTRQRQSGIARCLLSALLSQPLSPVRWDDNAALVESELRHRD